MLSGPPCCVMTGQYRLVLAVSSGIRAQGHLWALPEHPRYPILASLSRVHFGTWNNGKSVGSLGVAFQYVIEGTDTHLSLRGHLGVRSALFARGVALPARRKTGGVYAPVRVG